MHANKGRWHFGQSLPLIHKERGMIISMGISLTENTFEIPNFDKVMELVTYVAKRTFQIDYLVLILF